MSDLPTIHLPGLFHTANDQIQHSACAFTGKVRRFPKMMRPYGWSVIDYSNCESESAADEHVQILTGSEFNQFYPPQSTKEFHGSYAVIGDRGFPLFDSRLKGALKDRVKKGDIIVHSFGRSHADLVQMFPQAIHAELFIGYPDRPFGAYRVFESEIWRHYHWGRDDHDPSVIKGPGTNKLYSAVIPNYFDLDDWTIGDGALGYVLFMGRICPEKGMATIVEIIKRFGQINPAQRFVFAGQGDFEGLIASQLPEERRSVVEYRGPVLGRPRNELVGNAKCMLMPTQFVEPFGGSGVEAMLTGTPLIAQSYGAFVETVELGVSGYRCSTLADWCIAIQCSGKLDRAKITERARRLYSLETCGKQYDAFLRQLSDLWRDGWYARESYRVP